MITLFLTIIAGILNAAMDSIAMKYNKSIFPKLFPTKDQFFNPLVSWKNKKVSLIYPMKLLWKK